MQVQEIPIPDVEPEAAVLRRTQDGLCAAAMAMGLTLFASDDWTALEAINRANLGSWVPLLHRAASLPSFWIGAVDGAGEVVGTQAGLLVDCTRRSFAEHLRDLALFYDPADAPASERCLVADESPAWDTHGKVCWIAAGWTHPAHRGRGIFHLVGRTVRLVSWVRWSPSSWCGVVTPDAAAAWSVERAGPRHLDERPTIFYLQADVDRPPLRFLRLTRADVLRDFTRLAEIPMRAGSG